jgi:Anaerobic dehydrogenases, typically selenocysteine-containing
MLLAIANYLIQNNLYDREFVETWWNWKEYLSSESQVSSFEFSDFESKLKALYKEYTFEFAAKESGVEAKVIEEIAKLVSTAGTQFSSHNWRSVASGVSGGGMVARCLFFINALLGAIALKAVSIRTHGTNSSHAQSIHHRTRRCGTKQPGHESIRFQ